MCLREKLVASQVDIYNLEEKIKLREKELSKCRYIGKAHLKI